MISNYFISYNNLSKMQVKNEISKQIKSGTFEFVLLINNKTIKRSSTNSFPSVIFFTT